MPLVGFGLTGLKLCLGAALAFASALLLTLSIEASLATASALPYANCDQARAAGAAPVFTGQAGYSTDLDIDGDGVACEGGQLRRPTPWARSSRWSFTSHIRPSEILVSV